MTAADQPITIPLNKSKLIIMLVGAFAFVGIGKPDGIFNEPGVGG